MWQGERGRERGRIGKEGRRWERKGKGVLGTEEEEVGGRTRVEWKESKSLKKQYECA